MVCQIWVLDHHYFNTCRDRRTYLSPDPLLIPAIIIISQYRPQVTFRLPSRKLYIHLNFCMKKQIFLPLNVTIQKNNSEITVSHVPFLEETPLFPPIKFSYPSLTPLRNKDSAIIPSLQEDYTRAIQEVLTNTDWDF